MELEVDGRVWSILCTTESAPRTAAALIANLPMPVRFQTPKIAGSHLYWQSPILEDLEAGTDIMALSPGSFLYWPERQFLEILFAPLQQETASVTVLGRLERAGDVSAVAAFGALLRETSGRRPITGELRLTAPPPDPSASSDAAPTMPELASLREHRLSIWRSPPPELATLLDDRGILHPAGPVLFAEAEARALHELLWWYRRARDEDAIVRGAAVAIDKAAARLGGFCHLTSCANVLRGIADLIRGGDAPPSAILDEAILYAGGLSQWLDRSIPWNALNEAFREARGTDLDRAKETHP
jgi:hypothetical protein